MFQIVGKLSGLTFYDVKVGPENLLSSISMGAGLVFIGDLHTNRDRDDCEIIPPGCYTCNLF